MLDREEMQTAYPALDIRQLSVQHETYIHLRLRGQTPSAAARAAKLPHTAADIEAMHDDHPELDRALVYFREQIRQQSISQGVEVEFTRNDATLMYLEAHSKSATAMEEIKAIDSLVKLHGLAAPERKEIQHIHNRRQIEELSDDDLARLAGDEIVLDPADYKDVSDETDH